ncbi:hypothetical protein MKW98_003571 [Papaver atlanticum]|uniref:Uncharacterized protein n=1 Tax=Papaver atlanticum TaxID=357466 RepID=A0AAD4XUW4_9MAGN|nr:hypothetical protein MKW98_003571 [Papaver atlanticum]
MQAYGKLKMALASKKWMRKHHFISKKPVTHYSRGTKPFSVFEPISSGHGRLHGHLVNLGLIDRINSNQWTKVYNW